MAMEDNGSSKLTGIRQIIRLKEILQKWQSTTLSSNGNNSVHPSQTPTGISPAINMRLKNANAISDSDEDSGHSPEPPPDVPKGYLAVYVGSELRRFIIPTSYLTHSLFKVLLEKVEEEFGFTHSGGLTIPCEIETFKYLIKCIESRPEAKPDGDNTITCECSSLPCCFTNSSCPGEFWRWQMINRGRNCLECLAMVQILERILSWNGAKPPRKNI